MNKIHQYNSFAHINKKPTKSIFINNIYKEENENRKDRKEEEDIKDRKEENENRKDRKEEDENRKDRKEEEDIKDRKEENENRKDRKEEEDIKDRKEENSIKIQSEKLDIVLKLVYELYELVKKKNKKL